MEEYDRFYAGEKYHFYDPTETRITEVEIDGVVPPKAGSPVNISAYVPNNCGYEIMTEDGAPLVTLWTKEGKQITKTMKQILFMR